MSETLEQKIIKTEAEKEKRQKLLKALWTAKRNNALSSLFYFTKNILNNPDLTVQTHKELCDLIEDNKLKKKKLILLPRGTFKTTIITIAYSCYKIIKNRNIRILINSSTYDDAIKYLKKIKNILETNEHLRWLFGEFVGQVWKETEIVVMGRNMASKEPTVMCGSPDIQRIGMHYDLIINDDIVNYENTQTKEQIHKVIEFFKGQFSILEPDGEIIVVGTRWNYEDLYGYIIDNMAHEFEIYIKKAINENGELFFPERLSKEFLDKMMGLQGSAMFSNQYLNDPINPDEQIFRNITLFDNEDEAKPKDQLFYRSMTIDPAISTTKDADYTAITIVDTFEDSRMFVIEALDLKLAPDDVVDTIFDLAFRYKPDVIGFESVGFQKLFKYYIEKKMQDYKIFLPIEEIKTTNKISKNMKIMGLQPFIERKQMLIKSSLTNLIEQMRRYPKTTKDDLVDSLSMHLDIYRTPYNKNIQNSTNKTDRDYYGKARWKYKKDKSNAYLTDEHGLLN